MEKDQFENWMIRNAHLTPLTAYNYATAINRISSHFSTETGQSMDLYAVREIPTLADIASQYDIGGRYSAFGQIGNGTNRAAVKKLKKYREEYLGEEIRESATEETIPLQQIPDNLEQAGDDLRNSFSYERDLKSAVIYQSNELFPDHKIFNGLEAGVEYSINGKRIDILLESSNGELLVVELKSGTVDFKVFGQISMYMGMLGEKFPNRIIRGCIIASEFDRSLVAAVRTTNLVTLKRYTMKLVLE